jgi:hypothetical protein
MCQLIRRSFVKENFAEYTISLKKTCGYKQIQRRRLHSSPPTSFTIITLSCVEFQQILTPILMKIITKKRVIP